MKTALTYEEFIKLAEQNYIKGGDTFVECWDKRDFETYVKEFGAVTKTKALRMFKAQKELDDEYEAARRWYSGEDY